MKNAFKIGLAIVAAAALVISGILFWRSALTGKKHAVPEKRITAPKTAVKKKVTAPAMVKKFKNPRIAIVMDDFGNNTANLEELFSIGEPVTLSILPSLKHSGEVADAAHSRGYEVMLHLPLEPHNKEIREEADTIKSGMQSRDIYSRLDKEIASVPGLTGVSNHMGSKSTEDKALMKPILIYLKGKKLYFFDSLTSEKSVCKEIARSAGIHYARRDLFLDNANDIGYIERQLKDLEKLAFLKGSAIAVCHDRKNTVTALKKKMPEMTKDGVRFVYLSELVN